MCIRDRNTHGRERDAFLAEVSQAPGEVEELVPPLAVEDAVETCVAHRTQQRKARWLKGRPRRNRVVREREVLISAGCPRDSHPMLTHGGEYGLPGQGRRRGGLARDEPERVEGRGAPGDGRGNDAGVQASAQRHARTAGAPELLPDGPIDPLSELLDRGFVVKVALPLKVERVAAKALQAACGYAKDLASQHAADAAKCSGGGCRRPETAQDVGEVDAVSYTHLDVYKRQA